MGDLKLCAAVGGWIGPGQLGIALVQRASRRRAGARLGGMARIARRIVEGAGDLVSAFWSKGVRPHPAWFSITLPRGACPTLRRSRSGQFFLSLQYDGKTGKSDSLTVPLCPMFGFRRTGRSGGRASHAECHAAPGAGSGAGRTQFAPLVHEFGSYPSRDELPAIAQLGCQVLIVDLDDDVEQAIHVIENMGRTKPP